MFDIKSAVVKMNMYKVLFFLIVWAKCVWSMSPDIAQLLTPIEQYGEGCGYSNCPAPLAGVGGINVHIVPYTHFELGDLKNFKEHFTGGLANNSIKTEINVKKAYDFIVTEMAKHAELRFTISDMAYFFEWWKLRDTSVRKVVYGLLREGRLSFVGGSWGQSDEAITSYHSIIESFTFTLRKMNATFLECGRPLVAWQADVHGHSREFASLAAQMGFDGLFIHPISYDDELARMRRMALEMLWRGSDDLGMKSDIFTHVLFDGFWSPPGFCFGSTCSDKRIITSSDTFRNIKERAEEFIDLVYTRNWSSYNSSHVLIMMGQQEGYWDAPFWFTNLGKLMFKVNTLATRPNRPVVRMIYSSPQCYLQAVFKDGPPPLEPKQDDFMPVAFNEETVFIGHYTSFPSMKLLMREALVFLQMAKQLQVLAQLDENNQVLEDFMSIFGMFQDHTIATGASLDYVKVYYIDQLFTALTNSVKKIIRPAFNVLRKCSPKEFYFRCSFNESKCYAQPTKTNYIQVYNPLAWKVRVPVRFPIRHDGEKFTVHDPKGNLIPSSLIMIPDFVRKVRFHVVDYEVVFIAELPPLGFRSFFMERSFVSNTNRTKRSALQNETQMDNSVLYYKTFYPKRSTIYTNGNNKDDLSKNESKRKRSYADFFSTTDKLNNELLNEMPEVLTPLSSQNNVSEIYDGDEDRIENRIPDDDVDDSNVLAINVSTIANKTTNVPLYTYNDGIENHNDHGKQLEYNSTPALKSEPEMNEKIDFKALLDYDKSVTDKSLSVADININNFTEKAEAISNINEKSFIDGPVSVPDININSDGRTEKDGDENSFTVKTISISDIKQGKKPQMKIIDYIRENELGKSHRFQLTDEANKYLTQAFQVFTTMMPRDPKIYKMLGELPGFSNTSKKKTDETHIHISDKVLPFNEIPIAITNESDKFRSDKTYNFEENAFEKMKSKSDLYSEMSLNKSIEKWKAFDGDFLNLLDSSVDGDDKSNSNKDGDNIETDDEYKKINLLKYKFTIAPKTDKDKEIIKEAQTEDLKEKSNIKFNIIRKKGDFSAIKSTKFEALQPLTVVNETEIKDNDDDIVNYLSLPFLKKPSHIPNKLAQLDITKSDEIDDSYDMHEFDVMSTTKLPIDNTTIYSLGLKNKLKWDRDFVKTTTTETDFETVNSGLIKLDQMKIFDKVGYGTGYGSEKVDKFGKGIGYGSEKVDNVGEGVGYGSEKVDKVGYGTGFGYGKEDKVGDGTGYGSEKVDKVGDGIGFGSEKVDQVGYGTGFGYGKEDKVRDGTGYGSEKVDKVGDGIGYGSEKVDQVGYGTGFGYWKEDKVGDGTGYGSEKVDNVGEGIGYGSEKADKDGYGTGDDYGKVDKIGDGTGYGSEKVDKVGDGTGYGSEKVDKVGYGTGLGYGKKDKVGDGIGNGYGKQDKVGDGTGYGSEKVDKVGYFSGYDYEKVDDVGNGYGKVNKPTHFFRVNPTPEDDTAIASIDGKGPEEFKELRKGISTEKFQPIIKTWKYANNTKKWSQTETKDDTDKLLNIVLGSGQPQYTRDRNNNSETTTVPTIKTTTPTTLTTLTTITKTTTTKATTPPTTRSTRKFPQIGTEPPVVRRMMNKPIKVKKPPPKLFIENEYVHIDIDPSTHKITEVTLSNGLKMALDLQFYYYVSDDPGILKTPKIPPGSFVFRPLDGNPTPVLDFISLKIIKSTVVEEAHFEYSNWTSLVVRLYDNNPVIEVNWALAPVPIMDMLGKEVFIRYQTDLQHNGVFYTDSNGRQTIKRIRNTRAMYTPLTKDHVTGNFYPVTSKIYIEDPIKRLRFAVFPDRAEAGTSLTDGQLDLMITRRIHTDDQYGTTYFFADQGNWLRGKHYLYLTKSNYHPNRIFEKKFAKEVLFTPQLFVSDFNPNRNRWMTYKNDVSLLEMKLPVGIHILTIQPWNHGTMLLRLENYLEKSDTKKDRAKIVFIQQMFSTIIINRVEETTLAGNIWLKDYKPYRWLKKDKFIKNFNDYYSSGLDVEYQEDVETPYEPVSLENGVVIQPQQIRTFVCWFELVDMDAQEEK